VREADRERDDVAVDKNRPHHLDVVEVIAAERAELVDQRIAVVQAGGGYDLQQLRHGIGHGTEMDRDIAALPDQIALCICDRR